MYDNGHLTHTYAEIQENNLERTKSELEGIKKSISTFDDEFDRLALERAELVLQHQQRLAALREANQAVLEAQTRHIEAVSDVAALKLRNADIVQRLEEERQKVTDLTGQLEQLKSEAQNAGAILSELWTLESGDTDEGRRDLLIELAQDKTVESITEDIQTEEARLDLIHATDPGVLRDFEKRAQDIGRLEAAHAAAHENLQGLGERVQDLRGQWEPELDEIFRKINDGFSYNFEQIDCGGEVAIHKDEDFEKWAVHIKVKFRYCDACLSDQILGSSRTNTDRALLRVGKAKRYSCSITIANQVANVLSRPHSIFWPYSPWLRVPSAWLTRSTKVWTSATNARSTSA